MVWDNGALLPMALTDPTLWARPACTPLELLEHLLWRLGNFSNVHGVINGFTARPQTQTHPAERLRQPLPGYLTAA